MSFITTGTSLSRAHNDREKNRNPSIAAPRCALDVWKYVHRSNAQDRRPTPGAMEGASRACATSHPRLDGDSSPPPPSRNLFRLRVPRRPLRPLHPLRSSPAEQPNGVCVHRHRRPSFFATLSLPPSTEVAKTVGVRVGGCPEGAAIGVGARPCQFSYRTT